MESTQLPLGSSRLCHAGCDCTAVVSGMRPIKVGAYREHPIQIVSGPAGGEIVHYEAPPAVGVTAEMQRLLDWFNQDEEKDRLVQAALAHLWFETIHPFDDGNGRVGRVLVDLALARDSGEASCLMRISQRLLEKRGEYYEHLGRAQHGDCDVTSWVVWFVDQVRVACEKASETIDASLEKARFWATHRERALNERVGGGRSTRYYINLEGW